MKIINTILFLLIPSLAFVTVSCAGKNKTNASSLSTSELRNFASYPSHTQMLISQALQLSKRKLAYQFGSANPNNGGMDCSGTIHYLLQSYHLKNVPRQSDKMYSWVAKYGKFYPVKSNSLHSKEFNHLKPGDLLFWTGTYPVKRNLPITHVMLYLGKNNKGQRLMFGASNGRTYKSKQQWGVSVFDFKLPTLNSKGRFIGYGCIPNVSCPKQKA